MPQTLRHHQDPLVFLHQTNMLRQQGVDPGAPEGVGKGGVQAGSAGPGQLDPMASRSQEAARAGCWIRPQSHPEPAVQRQGHPPWGQGVRSLPGRLLVGHCHARGEEGWGRLLGERQ